MYYLHVCYNRLECWSVQQRCDKLPGTERTQTEYCLFIPSTIIFPLFL